MSRDYYYIDEAVPCFGDHVICVVKSSVEGGRNFKIQGKFVETMFDAYVKSYSGAKYYLDRIIAWKHVPQK